MKRFASALFMLILFQATGPAARGQLPDQASLADSLPMVMEYTLNHQPDGDNGRMVYSAWYAAEALRLALEAVVIDEGLRKELRDTNKRMYRRYRENSRVEMMLLNSFSGFFDHALIFARYACRNSPDTAMINTILAESQRVIDPAMYEIFQAEAMLRQSFKLVFLAVNKLDTAGTYLDRLMNISDRFREVEASDLKLTEKIAEYATLISSLGNIWVETTRTEADSTDRIAVQATSFPHAIAKAANAFQVFARTCFRLSRTVAMKSQ
ncbi:MAG: hypothetical protein GXO82_08205 [Chlorobi bacterium]|nr:hypothetical protein [Chlorobiota bacterium]